MNKSALKQPIIKIVKELREKGIKEIIIMSGVHRVINDVAIHKSLLEMKSFNSALQTFLNEQELNQKLAKKTIIMRFMKIVNDLLQIDEPSKRVNEMLEQLETEILTKKEFNVYIPIKGLDVRKQTFKIGNKAQIIELNEKIAESLIPDKDIAEFFPYSLEYIINIPDFLKALEIGAEASKIIVHFLRFVDYYIWDEETLGLRLPGFGVIREELRGIAVPKTRDGITNSYNWQLREATLDDLEIDDYFIEDAAQVGLSKFGNIIDNFIDGNLTDFENTILRSIVLFGESKVEHDHSFRFLKLTLVIECFLNTSANDPVIVTLSERVAFLLESSTEERLKMYDKVRKLYDVRSKVVHTGVAEIEISILVELEQIVSRLILLFLTDKRFTSLETKNELKTEIEKMKFS